MSKIPAITDDLDGRGIMLWYHALSTETNFFWICVIRSKEVKNTHFGRSLHLHTHVSMMERPFISTSQRLHNLRVSWPHIGRNAIGLTVVER